jgi:sugar phosphate isomerase/epimerase
MVFLRKSVSRRSLIKLGGLSFATFPFLSFSKIFASTSKTGAELLPKIALQLYSVSKELKKYPKETLKKISYIGYAGLETPHTFNGMTVDDYGKMLKKSGLDVIAMHTELPLDKLTKENVLLRAKKFKCKRIIWHGIPESSAYKTEEGIAQLAQKYNAASRFAKTNGLLFGIHNHWWEFEKMTNGKIPFDLLLDQLDPDIFFELDVYWIAVAGQDPVEIINKLGSRAPLLHVKDGPATWSPLMDEPIPYPVLAVGTGKMDYPAIFNASNGNAKWIIVDIEACKTDIIQAIYESFKYLAITNNYGIGLKQ